ncbi:MAG: TerB N-terminal domain-containing protein [Anaerolineales bacterium]|nr:TerB N-terminal domain-containing protein [Anaerolineales bacterium]
MFRKLSGLGLIILALILLGDANMSCLAILLFGLGGFLLLSSTTKKKGMVPVQKQPTSRSPAARSTSDYGDVTVTITTHYTSRESSFVEAARKYVNRSGKPCSHVHFKSYWPTYGDMNKAQQNWYFYWRNQVRNDHFPDTSLSYIFLHVYELINNVGVRNVDDGYRQLRRLWLNYRDRFPNLDRYLADWLTDYLVVNRPALDPLHVYADKELQPALAQQAPDLVLNAFLKQGKSVGEMPLFLLDALTDYKIHKSKFYQSGYADMVQTALRQALEAAEAYLQEKEGRGIFQKFRPQPTQITRRVFQSAIYDGEQNTIPIAHVYPYASYNPLRKFLTEVVKHTENLLRQHYGFSGRLQVKDLPRRVAGAIEAALLLPTDDGNQAAEFDLPDTGTGRTAGVAIPAQTIGDAQPVPSRILATIPSSGNLKIVSKQYLNEAQKLASRKVKQAKFVPLESPFTSYSHDYQFLNQEQRQWYFYWRDQVRQGQYLATDLAYIFIYAPELVHLVGADGPGDAYQQLRALWLNYRDQHPKIEPYLLSWMLSLVTAYDCEVSSRDVLLTPEAFDFTVSIAPDVLFAQYVDGNLRELPIALLEKYVDYTIQRSSFYTSEHEALVQQVLPAAIDIVNTYQANNGNGPLFTRQTSVPVIIELKRCWRADQTYLDWPMRLYFEDVPAYSQNQTLRRYLTGIVKYTENKLREEKNFRGRLRVLGLDRGTRTLIDRLIAHNGHVISPPPAVPKIEIDLSQVERLRAESEEVLSMLQIEEEAIIDDSIATPEPTAELFTVQPVTESAIQEQVMETEEVETEEEMWAAFAHALESHQVETLAAIIDGPDPKAAIHHIATAQFLMPTMLVDDINELARDILGDILIESADEPRLVDDYYAPMVSQIVTQGRSQ